MTSTMPGDTRATPDGDPRRASLDIGAIVTRGATAGLAGGLLFALSNMWYSGAHGKPIVAPFLSISTIFHASDKPMMSQPDVIAGLVLHLGLSLVFGIVFALGVSLTGVDRKPLVLVAAAVGYGLVLYLVNFQILARLFFPFFVSPKGPNQLFEVWIHPVAYGLLLVPFLLAPRRAR